MCIDVEKSQLLAGSARERVSSLLRCCQCLSEGEKKKIYEQTSCYSSQPSGSAHLASLFGYKPTDKSTERFLTRRVVDVKKRKGNKASTKREADTSSPNFPVLDVHNSHFHKSPVGFLFIFHTFQGLVFLERTRYEILEAPAL